jgi:tRNA threonylcarbamoyl adenosine modification protein YeaZ
VIVLAIDTATPAVTAGVVVLDGPDGPGPRTLAQRVTVDARAHGELLTPHIQDALRSADLAMTDLDAVVCGAGPGPFTGLRVGMVTAAAIGDALDLPVYPVCSLDAIAAEVIEADTTAQPLLVVTDARRREVYWAAYDGSGHRVDGPNVQRPGSLVAGPGRVAGQGGVLYADVLGLPVVAPEFPSPRGLVAVAAAALLAKATPDPLTPLYLRRPDAVVPGASKKVAR